MTKHQKKRIGVVAIAIALVAAACTLHLSLGDGERRTVAGELVANVIVPTYEDVAMRTEAMKVAAHAFGAAPSQDTLDAYRTAWRWARVPWKQTDAFRFGPMALQSLGVAMDQFPVDPPKIEMEIAGTGALDGAYFATIGANRKGFHAIEYILFDAGRVGDPALIANLTADTRRRQFIVGAADDIAANAVALRDAWSEYAAELADPGAGNPEFPTVKASIDALVNEITFQAEVIADARIGKPYGLATGGTVQPDLEESKASDNSIDDMLGALASIRMVYEGSLDGTPGGGIGKLLSSKSKSLELRVREQIASCDSLLRAIPRPYAQALADQHPSVMAAYTALQDLQSILATEVIATLGATLKFNDNDGD